MSARELITEHLDLWTGAVTHKSNRGRGSNGKIELTGIKKLRELILELAVRGKLVDQDPDDEPASEILERIAEEKSRLVKEGKIKKLADLTEEEKPFELPGGWQWTKLSDVLRVINGRAYKKHEMLTEGTPLLRVGNLFTSNEWYYSDLQLEDDKYINHGDLIYAWSASFGPFIWDGGRAIYHYHIWKLELFDHLSTSKHFLYNYLKAVTEEIKSSGSGIAMVHMTKAKMEGLVVPFPPLAEQNRIVEKVDELMALCDRVEQQVDDQLEAHKVLVDTLLDALNRSGDAAEVAENWARISEHFDTLFTTEASIDKLKQTILQLAVMGRLVPQDPDDEPVSMLLKRIAEEKARLVEEGKIKKQKKSAATQDYTPSFSLPAQWSWESLGELTSLMDAGWSPACPPGPAEPDTWGVLKTTAVQVMEYLEDENKKLTDSKAPKKHYEVKSGDILITRAGPKNRVGISCVVKKTRPKLMISDKIIRFHLIEAGLSEEYICLCLNAGETYHHLESAKSGMAESQMNISQDKLKAAPIPLCPTNEQHRIIERVNELMVLCDRLKARLGETGETRAQLAEAVVEQAVQ